MWTLLLEKNAIPKKGYLPSYKYYIYDRSMSNYCCSVVSQVPCWLPGKSGIPCVEGICWLAPWTILWAMEVLETRTHNRWDGETGHFDRDYVSRIVNPLVYDVDLSIYFYISRFCQLEWRNRSHYCFIEQYCIHSKAPSIQKHSKNNRIVESS